jgi:hypothetical protein
VGDAFLAGDVERTRALAARVLDGPAGRAARAQVLSTLGVLEQYAGSVPRAAELLATAAELADGSQRVWALAELGHTRFRLGDPGQRALAEFARGIALTVGGDPAAGRPLLADVLELLQSPPLRDDPRYPTWGWQPASWAMSAMSWPWANAGWPRRASAAPLACWSPGWP